MRRARTHGSCMGSSGEAGTVPFPITPSCTASATSASCAARRMPRNWSRRPGNSVTPRSPSPTNVRWPGVVRAHAAAKKIGGIKLLYRRGIHARLRPAPGDHRAQPRGLWRACRGSSRAAGARRRRAAIRSCAPTSRNSSPLALTPQPGEDRRRWHARLVAAATATRTLRRGLQGAVAARALRAAAPGSRWSWCATAATASGSRMRARWASSTGLPLTAAGDVHMHVRERRRLQDALTAVRHGVTRGRGRRAPAPEWRAAPARARAARAALSTRAARRDREDRRARGFLARRAALRISARARARGRNRRPRTCAS